MVISFFGHSNFCRQTECRQTVMNLLESIIGKNEVNFYLGGYGSFDNFAYRCCKEYKKAHPSASLVFVTPYLDESYNKNHFISRDYDAVVYPPIEDIPKKYAVIHRNRYMVEISDVIIAYVNHKFGGAYKAYSYAVKQNKMIYNIYIEDFSKIT